LLKLIKHIILNLKNHSDKLKIQYFVIHDDTRVNRRKYHKLRFGYRERYRQK